jgi:predicted nucleic acid-binding protein
MPRRLIDLGQPGARLPDSFVVDTNLVAARLLASYYPPHLETAERTHRFFSLLRTQGLVGLLPTVVCHEFFHLALRGEYQLALPDHRSALAAERTTQRRFNWENLYKSRPDLIDEFLPALQRFFPLFRFNSLTAIQPEELAPLPPNFRYEEELLRLVGRYQLDTNDAAILLEAQRAGITSIATLDADMLRAQADFDVYTWL